MSSTKRTLVCSYWLVKEGAADPRLNYDGTHLKRCTRCTGAYYVNGDAQKSHWKVHKKHCQPINASDLENISQYTFDECANYFRIAFGGRLPKMSELYHVIKRVRKLFYADTDGSIDAAYDLHSIARGYLVFLPSNEIFVAMAACPHMPSLLFGDEEDLLSPKNKLLKYTILAKYNGRPSEEFVEDIEDASEKKEVKKLVKQYDRLDRNSFGMSPPSMRFCYLYYNMIVACAIYGNSSSCSIHDGCGTLRCDEPNSKSPMSVLSTAALRRALELWTDPLVLSSCGDAMAPAASLALTAIEYYRNKNLMSKKPLCRDHELVPGLAIDRLALTCMRELLEGAGSVNYSVKLLKLLGAICLVDCDPDTCPWIHLSITRRAKFALATYHFIEEGGGGRSGLREIEPPTKAVASVFRVLCGLQNPKDEDNLIAKSIWQKAAEDGEFIGPDGAGSGFNTRGRAFYYHLLRADTPAYGWDKLDIYKQVKEFESIPRIHKAPNNTKSKEKDECLRLAYGDKRHKEMNAMWKRMDR